MKKSEQDALGLFAFGSLIVNLAQAGTHTNLQQRHQQLLAMFRGLVGRYKITMQEFEVLRATNQRLLQQGRDYQRIVDELRAQLAKTQQQLAAKEVSQK